MKINKTLATIFCLLLLVASCHNNEKEQILLSRLSVGIELHPDSVLQVLDSLKENMSFTSINEARWNLLYVRAFEEKTYALPSDSLVLAATDVLCKKGDVREQAYSYFYLGRWHMEKEENNEAMSCYLKALDLAKEVEEYRLAGLVCSYMGDVYLEEERYDRRISILKEAEMCFTQSRNARSQLFTLKKIAHTFLFQNLPDSALIYCAQADVLARKINDQDAIANVLHEYASIYSIKKDFEAAEFYIKKAMEITTDSALKEKETLLYIDINIELKKYNIATDYLLPLLQLENLPLIVKADNLLKLSQIKEGQKDYHGALKYIQEYYDVYDSLMNFRQGINTLKIESNRERERFSLEMAQREKTIVYLIILSGSLLLGEFIVCWAWRKSFKKCRVSRREICILKKECEKIKIQLLSNSEQLQKMSLLSSVPSHKQKEIKEKLEEAFLSSEVTSEDWIKLEEQVNQSQNDFVQKLRAQYPALSEDEIHMIILIRLGWDNNQLATFYRIKIETVMTKRSRARKKMLLKREEDMDEFVRQLFSE